LKRYGSAVIVNVPVPYPPITSSVDVTVLPLAIVYEPAVPVALPMLKLSAAMPVPLTASAPPSILMVLVPPVLTMVGVQRAARIYI